MTPARAQAFLDRQADDWDRARAELAAGAKTSHWIWWILPQLASLGRSQRARVYGLANLDEAAVYLGHPVLGPRLIEACHLILSHAGRRSARDIMGSDVDTAKLRSCATLFSAVPGADPVFSQVLDVYFGGTPCGASLAEIGSV